MRDETGIATAPASVSSIAADLAEEIADDLRGRRALFLGTSKVGRLAAKSLRTHGFWEMTLVPSNADDCGPLATELGATIVSASRPRFLADITVPSWLKP